jgi:hypothetical protein
MTDLTPREILDAIRRGLEETWRRLDAGKAAQTRGPGRPLNHRDAETVEDSAVNRKS